MKVLFVASEAFPFARTGGLGDVIFSLPKELRKLGVDARVMIPKYGDIPSFFREKMTCKNIFSVPVGWRNQYCGVEELKYEDMPFYFIDNEYYFKRQGLYGFYDEAERYAFFCKAALEAVKYMDFVPDIIHTHDWQTGMINVLLKAKYADSPEYARIKTVFTIHNLQYQGVFPKEVLGELLNLSEEYFRIDGLEFFGAINFMKGGLNFSDVITTVSSTYAEEIQMPHFGERLDDLMRRKKDKLVGIVNGIDDSLYNPENDKNIFTRFNYETIDKKVENKIKLQELLGLPINPGVPMLAMVTRFTRQKGIELIAHVLDELLSMDVQLVVLGTGEERYEALFREYAYKYPDKFSANIAFDDTLAHRIYAASDLFLMPSLYEPCGIGQLIALKYGCLPIVRETGGLKDTVVAYDENTGIGNGFSFDNYNAHDFLFTVRRALGFFYQDTWTKIVYNAMHSDNSSRKSAQEYYKLYQSII